MAKSSRLLPVSRAGGESARDLRRLDEALDRAVTSLQTTFRTRMDRELRGWLRRTVSGEDFPVTAGGALASSQRAVQHLGPMAVRWRREMEPAVQAVRAALQAAPGVLVDFARRGLEQVGRTVTMRTGVLEGFYRTKRDELEGTLHRMGSEVVALTRKAVISGQLIRELYVESAEVVEAAGPVLERQFETALMELVQLITLMAAKPGDVYLYSGPIDSRIRPFCLRHVGRVYTRPTIDKMDNGQLPNTFLTRGGYRCRHLWRVVTDAKLAALADTGQMARASWGAEVQSLEKVRRTGTS